MANVIQIKRGSGTPSTSDLAQYELAYDYTNDKLYIHDPTNSSGQEIVEIGGGASTSGSNNQVLTDDGSGGIVSEGQMTFDGGALNLLTTTANRRIEIGLGATADVTSFVDLIGDTTYSDYGGRFIRYGGANAVTQIMHRGTGDLRLLAQDAGAISLRTSSAERLRILSGGNVGVGAANPLRKLHVVGDFAVNGATDQYYGIHMTGGESNDPKILIGDWHSSSGSIMWDSSSNVLKIDSQHSSANGSIVFTGNDFATNYMRINSSGNVGIGTDSPGNKLEVRGDIAVAISDTQDIIKLSDAGNDGSIELYTGESTPVLRTKLTAYGDSYFGNSNAQLGIGTTSPSQKLHIVNSSNSFIHLQTTGDAGAQVRHQNDNISVYTGVNSADQYVWYHSSTGSNVGYIPTSGMLYWNKDINLSTNATYLRLRDTNGASTRAFGMNASNITYIGPIDSYAGGEVYYGASSNVGNHRWWVGGTERMRITPSSLIILPQNQNEGGEIALNPGTDPSYTTTFYLDSFQNKFRIHSSGSERFTIGTDGTLTLNGTVAGSAVLDEDDMASNHASKLASQQSIKAYVDANASSNAQTLDGYDSTRFFRRQGSASATVGPGWMTVATNTSGRRAGEILVTDGDSGDHGFIRIHWLRSYMDSNFTVINCGGHQNRITGVRVLSQDSDNTYGEKVLQVYVTTSSSYDVKIFRMGDDAHYSDHTVHTPTIENSITGYSLHGNQLEDLNTYGFAHEEGIQAGGVIKSKSNMEAVNITSSGTMTATRLDIKEGTTTVGDIQATDTTWLRINQSTAKNIYTPRYIRADSGFFVDGSSQGITGNGTLRVPGGSASAPSMSFSVDTDTGMYKYDANTLGFSVGGAIRASINNSGILYVTNKVQAGSAGIEVWDSTHGFKQILGKDSTYTYLKNNDGNINIHLGDSGDGNNYYNSGGHRFRSMDGGTYFAAINSTGLRIGTGGSFASYRLDVVGGARITADARVEGRVLAAPGSASAPAYSFYSDGDLGMYRSGDNDLAFAANGGQVHYELLNGLNRFHKNVVVGPNNNNSKAYIRANNGYSTATTPDYTWYYNDQCGIYHPAGNTIGFSASGEKVKIGTYGLYSASSVYVAHGGSDYTPNISFLGGSNTPGSNAYENAGIGYYDNSGTGSMKFFGNRNVMSWFFADSDETLFSMASDGTFHAEADVVAYSQTTNSDRRLKENINPIQYGLKEVLEINPVKYKWIEKRGGKEDIGVIAQDIEKIIPEIVQENKALNSDEMIKSVDYGKMVAVLIKAVQEQQEQINELKEKLNG